MHVWGLSYVRYCRYKLFRFVAAFEKRSQWRHSSQVMKLLSNRLTSNF
jgi:hypothetical protein